MKTSTELGSPKRLVGEERAIELIAQAGFDAWDYTMTDMAKFDWRTDRILPSTSPLLNSDYLAFARKLRRVGEDNGIRCNQSHAPFPVRFKAVKDLLKRSIEITAEVGGDICVIHPDNDKTPEQNAETYLEILPFAKSAGVKIATENMWNWNAALDHALPAACSNHENFLAHIKAVNDPYLVACLDIGHAEMYGLNTSSIDMIKTLGKSVQSLHIHDNDKRHDLHKIPFSESIEFSGIVKALKEIDYDGYFTLEVDSYFDGKDVSFVKKGMAELFASVRKLADEFENLV